MRALIVALALVASLATSGLAQTAVELKKELLPKMKKAQAEGKSLGEAEQLYKQGDEALKNGLQDEAVEAFKKAKEAMPPD
jgi:outer membrane protein assembly factor BamD (BamD/ComL family)